MKGVGGGRIGRVDRRGGKDDYNNLYKQEVATPLCPSVAQNPVER